MAVEPKPDGAPSSSNLTAQQKQKIETWFKTKAVNSQCPVCGVKSWTVLGDLLAPPTFHGGSVVIGGPSYPHFVLACTNCGNSQFINAVITGVVEGEK